MSTEQIPDFQVVECFDSITNKCISKQYKITKKTGILIELIWKIIELFYIAGFIISQLIIYFNEILPKDHSSKDIPKDHSCKDIQKIYFYICHQTAMITFLIIYGLRVITRLIFLFKIPNISTLQIFFRKEQPKRFMFGFAILLLSLWGLLANILGLSSLYKLHFFYIISGVIISLCTLINMKLLIVNTLPVVAEENLQQQQQELQLIERRGGDVN